MEYSLDCSATHVDLKSFEPGQYVRFNTRSHGLVIMVAIKEKLYGRSEDQAIYRFLITSGGLILIDGVPAEIRTGQAFSVGNGQVTLEITDLIHIDC